MTPELTKLNLGCGFKKLDDHWNVDIQPECNPNEVLDLETTPWPYEDNFFDRITATNILEHLGQDPKVFTNIMKEMYRVSKDQAEWFIEVPHHRCDLFFDDYTHVRALTVNTFKLFDVKFNQWCINNKRSDSAFGIYHNIDLEVKDAKYNIIPLWQKQVNEGMLGPGELNIKLNTLANVCETVQMFICVHKPGRNYVEAST